MRKTPFGCDHALLQTIHLYIYLFIYSLRNKFCNLAQLAWRIATFANFLEQEAVAKMNTTISSSSPQYKLLKTNDFDGIEIAGWKLTAKNTHILNSTELEKYTSFFIIKIGQPFLF